MIRRSIFAGLFVGLLLALAWIPAANAAGSGVPLRAGPFVMNFRSQATRDGYMTEASENSNTAGVLSTSGPDFWLGDSFQDAQYRALLSFNTSGLPDNATITKVQLKVKTSGTVYLGTDPFTTLGYVIVDIRKGFFGASLSLQVDDWSAASHGVAGRIYNTPVSGWYTSTLNSVGRAYIHLSGNTQFRLRFQVGDNDNLTTDARAFWEGDVGGTYRPLLRVWYTTP